MGQRAAAALALAAGVGYIGLPYILTQYLGLGTLRTGPLDRSALALTFDDGPHPVHTPRILDALRAADMRATFFLLLGPAMARPDLVRRIVAEGHSIGVHAARHRHAWVQSPLDSYADPLQAKRGLEAIVGQPILWGRPPHGAYTAANLLAFRRAGLAPVHWSLEGGDWRRGMTPQRLRARLRQRWHGGAVVVLHDGGAGGPVAAQALPGLLADLRRLGLHSVTLDRLGAQPLVPRQLPAQAMQRLDGALDAATSIRPAAEWHGGLFRVQALPFPLRGLPVPRGAGSLEFHVNNPLFVALGLRRFVPRARREFRLVAQDLLTRPEYAGLEYVFCLSVHGPVLARLGFAEAPLAPFDCWRLGLWSQAMHWAYGSAPRNTQPTLSYLPRHEFLSLYGG